jgi:hypothetical protein
MTLTIELDEEVVSRAEAEARRRGTTLSQEVRSFVEERASESHRPSVGAATSSVAQDFVAFVEGLQSKFDDRMPNRAERTAR